MSKKRDEAVPVWAGRVGDPLPCPGKGFICLGKAVGEVPHGQKNLIPGCVGTKSGESPEQESKPQYRMSKKPIQVPAKLFRIGELVRHTPFSRQTIHNYTIMGLIKESEWSEGGHRLYDESVFSRLSHILKLKETKTLSEIRSILLEQD